MSSNDYLKQTITSMVDQRMRQAIDDARRRLDEQHARRQVKADLIATMQVITNPDALDRAARVFVAASGSTGREPTDADRTVALEIIGSAFGSAPEAPCKLCDGAGSWVIGPWGSRAPKVECECDVITLSLTASED